MEELTAELLKELYINKNLKQKEIAARFGTSQTKVCNLLKKNKIYKDNNRGKVKNHNKSWTKEQIKILYDSYGKFDYEIIGKRIGKTAKAIENKKNRLNLGDPLRFSEYITARELSMCLGRSPYAVINWIKKRGLPASYAKVSFKQKFYRIKISNFWNWAKNNLDLMKWELYKRNCMGMEPSWLDEEIKRYNKKEKVNCKRWSETDICYLVSYYKKGLSYKEISKKINRTEAAIDKRLKILGIERRYINLPWREEETEILRKMRSDGKTYREISEELGRAMSIVAEKCQLYHIEKGKNSL